MIGYYIYKCRYINTERSQKQCWVKHIGLGHTNYNIYVNLKTYKILHIMHEHIFMHVKGYTVPLESSCLQEGVQRIRIVSVVKGRLQPHLYCFIYFI